MAEMLVKTSVKLGKAIPVKNIENSERQDTKTDLAVQEPDVYYALQVEDYSGKEEQCLLLTFHELFEVAPRFELPREMTDNLLIGRMYPMKEGNKSGCLVKIISFKEDGTPFDEKPTAVYFGDWMIEKSTKRADKHPKSITKKSWLTDWLD